MKKIFFLIATCLLAFACSTPQTPQEKLTAHDAEIDAELDAIVKEGDEH